MSSVVWWNLNYKFRIPIDVTNPVNDVFSVGSPISYILNKNKTVDLNKIRNDFEDIEVIYFDGVSHEVLGRSISVLPDVLKADFDGEELDPTYPYTPLEVVFPAESSFVGQEVDKYFIYYGNFSPSLLSSRPAYLAQDWPVAISPGGVGFSYLKPNEDWQNDKSNKKSSKITFTFYGDRVRVIANKTSSSGYALISLDDGPAQSVNFYSLSSLQAVVFEITDLHAGYHHISIEVEGKKQATSADSYISVHSIEYKPVPNVQYAKEEHQEIAELSWEKFIVGGY